ncbi:acyl-CoA thioesterase [Crocinitomix catalasitica]|uniref:acyl-CoA thioesterase n=1 Tax=Crocinitomix catalasitica TaxID=184607 RepID=UPI00068773C0|nr:acyl-CoA thioesterase [Crocinitomix catalasitica]
MISTKIQLRFSDFDMGNHVHNAAYLQYFEIARIGFFTKSLGDDWDWKKNGIIIKKNTIEYLKPIFIDAQISVEVTCSQIGNKSFTLAYQVKDQNGDLKAFGESLVVCFDYIDNVTTTIPKTILNILELNKA